MPWQIPFRHLCNLIQIAGGDTGKTIAELQNAPNGPKPEQLDRLKTRAACARYWVEECAPEEFRFALKDEGAPPGLELSETEKAAIRGLRDKVISRIETFPGDKECAEAIYQIAEEQGIEGKALFRAAYQALINKDQGPRLANFLRSIHKERLLGILASY
jgi:lysyl-tRNA synthetase class 1